MTKDWDSVEAEIRELYSKSDGKITLGEIEKLMARKKFRASTRAYRMKLKEWGLLKQKGRRETVKRLDDGNDSAQPDDAEHRDDRSLSATVEPSAMPVTMSLDVDTDSTPEGEATPADPALPDHCTDRGGWQVIEDPTNAEPTLMGLLHQAPVSMDDAWSETQTRPGDIVLDMLGAVLECDPDKLQGLVVHHNEHINDPIGLPFEAGGRFASHSIMNQMVIMQHPSQTLLDVTCGMPCGPCLWVLISHGAKGSRHPLGTDLALHNAIKNGRTVNVMVMARPGRSDINGLPGTSWKPLLQAVFWNHPDVVRILIRRGVSLEDAGLSPRGSGYQTALQLCLERRATEYILDTVREKCNNIARHLLEAGANIHAAPPIGSSATPFETFTQPWQTLDYWASKLTVIELDCLRIFVAGGANLQSRFAGCPCGSSRQTFQHQVIWHSTPKVARLVIDSATAGTGAMNISGLLHEILEFCPESKRHPADTLRDLQVLLQKGADPNHADNNGLTPLRRCIEQCPAVDLVALLRMLLDAGADPEHEDREGIQPFVLAARTIEEPLLSDVMQAMVSSMRGRYRRIAHGVPHTWSAKHFPINSTQTYEQVMSSTRNTGDFRLKLLDMVPEDIRATFQRAYFTVVSKNFLDTMTRTAKARLLTAKDKDEIVWIVGMRRGIDLPEYRFDQELVIALLDPQPISGMLLRTTEIGHPGEVIEEVSANSQPPPAFAFDRQDTTTTSTSRPAWKFNPDSLINSAAPPATTSHNASTSVSPADDDYMVPPTTLIRWRNPESQLKPGDLQKACASVLRYECATCSDGMSLTKKEHEKHEQEHAHMLVCEEVYCARRFCALRNTGNVSLGCQNYLFST
ncbi:hypothetical protein HBI09_210000 [Parastagonospora nodorum]|nr:hypothetical protein HBI09_210000 [Parastagonospora nodorum]KAH4999281.1 hypothetical protein HBI77_178070 [Parastagonospora nodorum]